VGERIEPFDEIGIVRPSTSPWAGPVDRDDYRERSRL